MTRPNLLPPQPDVRRDSPTTLLPRRTSRPRELPPNPAHNDVLGEDLPKPEHDSVHERQQHVDRNAREQGERARPRAQRRIEHGERRRVRALSVLVVVMRMVRMRVPRAVRVSRVVRVVGVVVRVRREVAAGRRRGRVRVGREGHGREGRCERGRHVVPLFVLRVRLGRGLRVLVFGRGVRVCGRGVGTRQDALRVRGHRQHRDHVPMF